VVRDALTGQRPEAAAADRARDSSEGRAPAGVERALALPQLGVFHSVRHEDLPFTRRPHESNARASAGRTRPSEDHCLTPAREDANDASPGAGQAPQDDALRANVGRLLGPAEGLVLLAAAAVLEPAVESHVSPLLVAN